MVSKGTQDLLINLGIVVLVIVVIYVVIIRNPNALNWLKGIGSKTGAAKAGAVVTGANVYQTTTNSCPNTCNGPNCGGSNSVRSEHDDCALTNYEATAIIQYGSHSTCDVGTEFDIKMGGPTHGNDGISVNSA